jgi:uncharacterized cupredoxin-like copper-binding protein
MKGKGMQIKTVMLTTMLSLGAASNNALASGTHAGGHVDAIGVPGDLAGVTRTIAVHMTDDMRFTPERISVRRGETIRFKVTNAGKIKHELVLGTQKALQEHYEAMKKFPEMEHADENMVTLLPAKTGEIVWKFTKSGKVDFACLQPGHYAAGMKGQVMVTAKKTQGKQ